MVHGNFSPDNVLVLDGRVTAVIDFAYADRGTHAIDLARLPVLWYGDLDPPLRHRLYRRIRDISGIGGMTICVAEQVIDRVACMIGYHTPESVERSSPAGWRIFAGLRDR